MCLLGLIWDMSGYLLAAARLVSGPMALESQEGNGPFFHQILENPIPRQPILYGIPNEIKVGLMKRNLNGDQEEGKSVARQHVQTLLLAFYLRLILVGEICPSSIIAGSMST